MYLPLLLYQKKHYSGIKYESIDDPGKRDVKGLAFVRKTICPFMRQAMLSLLDHLLKFDTPGAIVVAQQAAETLLSGSVALKSLVMSSSLGDDYKSDAHAQVQVTQRTRERAPGTEAQVGDRVEYVWIEVGSKSSQGYKRAEDPAFVEANPGIKPDYLEYFERQMQSQLIDLLGGIDPFATPRIQARLELLRHARLQRDYAFKRAADKQHAITNYFRKQNS